MLKCKICWCVSMKQRLLVGSADHRWAQAGQEVHEQLRFTDACRQAYPARASSRRLDDLPDALGPVHLFADAHQLSQVGKRGAARVMTVTVPGVFWSVMYTVPVGGGLVGIAPGDRRDRSRWLRDSRRNWSALCIRRGVDAAGFDVVTGACLSPQAAGLVRVR